MDRKERHKVAAGACGKDYDAAETYLQLLYDRKKARRWAKQLKRAVIQSTRLKIFCERPARRCPR